MGKPGGVLSGFPQKGQCVQPGVPIPFLSLGSSPFPEAFPDAPACPSSPWSLWPPRPPPGSDPRIFTRARTPQAAKQQRSPRRREPHAPARGRHGLEGVGHRGAWPTRGPGSLLVAAGPRGAPREQGPSGPRTPVGARRRAAGLGESGGGQGVRAAEGVSANRQHMLGAVPGSWWRVGPPPSVDGGC